MQAYLGKEVKQNPVTDFYTRLLKFEKLVRVYRQDLEEFRRRETFGNKISDRDMENIRSVCSKLSDILDKGGVMDSKLTVDMDWKGFVIGKENLERLIKRATDNQ